MAYDTSKLASLQALKDTATRIKKEYIPFSRSWN